MSTGGSGTGGPEHPNTINPCDTAKLSLDAGSLTDQSNTVARATALLLAAKTFLGAAADARIPLKTRAELEEAAFKLFEQSANAIPRGR